MSGEAELLFPELELLADVPERGEVRSVAEFVVVEPCAELPLADCPCGVAAASRLGSGAVCCCAVPVLPLVPLEGDVVDVCAAARPALNRMAAERVANFFMACLTLLKLFSL